MNFGAVRQGWTILIGWTDFQPGGYTVYFQGQLEAGCTLRWTNEEEQTEDPIQAQQLTDN